MPEKEEAMQRFGKNNHRDKPEKDILPPLVFRALSCYQSSFANADCSDVQF